MVVEQVKGFANAVEEFEIGKWPAEPAVRKDEQVCSGPVDYVHYHKWGKNKREEALRMITIFQLSRYIDT